MPKPVCGNDPAFPKSFIFSRRSLLTALPMVGMVGIAQSETSDPVFQLYLEWLSARRGWELLSGTPGHESGETPEMLALEDRFIKIERVMITERPNSTAGIAGMAALAWSFITPGLTDPIEMQEAVSNSVECRAILAIWTACTGKEGYPEI